MRADPLRIKQVLLNLLTNAIKSTPHDGVVTLSLSRVADDQAELTVRGTGTGIEADDIENTLMLFGQILQKNGMTTNGTGLGLPIAKALVARQRGKLVLEGRLDESTVVQVRLPALTGTTPS